jgi:thiamine kinase-like enzyme
VTRSPDEILAKIPGWEGARYARLAGGLTNNSWRVVQGELSGVLKIDEAARELPFNTRHSEALVQNTAASAGLAPKVILANDEMYFTEYVEGTVWGRDCFEKESNLKLLAAVLKRVHSLPLTGRSFAANVAAKRYVEETSDPDSNVVEQCMTIITSMRLPQKLCCCHNDLVVENLVTTPDLMFLDWEYACDNDPFFDLATIVEHHELGEPQVEVLLNAYFEGDTRYWETNLQEQRRCYLALLYLWMASRAAIDSVELECVAERIATSGS